MQTTTDMPVIDEPMSQEDIEFYERKFEDQEAKKHAHVFTVIYGIEDAQLAGMGLTLCDRLMRFGKVTTLDKVKCARCVEILAERVGKES